MNENKIPGTSLARPGIREEQIKEDKVSLREITFDPNCKELVTAWFTNRSHVITINPYPNGIALSLHKNPDFGDLRFDEEQESNVKRLIPNQFHLRLKETREYLLPHGKYHLIKDRIEDALELHLRQLRDQRILQNAALYFGMTTDPFFALPKKFDITMKCLELIEKYPPGLLVIQSRSPLILAALPILKHFGEKAVAVLGIETALDSIIQQYTPGQASIMDRLVAADGLKSQGIKVNLQVSPVLPYGDFYRDAWGFAELLAQHGDYVTLGSLATGSIQDEPVLRALPLARRLSNNKHYRLLRPHAQRYLFHALQTIAPEKLLLPVKTEGKQSQLSLFAA